VINRINNLPNFSQWKSKIERTVIKIPNEINLVFFSRISPMKNLHYLLDILSEIDINVNLDVYGPKEDLNYLNSCENKISVLPNNVKVNLLGTLSPENAYSVMKEYDLFVLPTLGENFGQAIWEALASSLPILISDRTPWKNLEKIGVGWEVSLEKPSHFLRIIKKVYSMDEHEHRILRDKSRKFALDYVESSDSLHKLRIIYSR
uniref:glycosyltransferase n=1 Tax=Pseudoalteromonas sp. SK18 TaxID=1938366 RepID=UPI0011155D82